MRPLDDWAGLELRHDVLLRHVRRIRLPAREPRDIGARDIRPGRAGSVREGLPGAARVAPRAGADRNRCGQITVEVRNVLDDPQPAASVLTRVASDAGCRSLQLQL